jgi:predicted NACHT family NTPase/nucleoside phosphorylase
MSRSLRVAPEYIDQVKLAIKRVGFPSQQALATESGFGRSTVNNFVNGKPVDFNTFVEICNKLGLEWQTIVDTKQTEKEIAMSEISLRPMDSHLPIVVILTAIKEETTAVLYHLGGAVQTENREGYFCKNFRGNGQDWLVAVKEIGPYNDPQRTTNVLNYWQPNVILLVGVAGTLKVKDADLADVVAARIVRSYVQGRVEDEQIRNRSQFLGKASEELIEQANQQIHRNTWIQRIEGGCPQKKPKAVIEAIVSGDMLLAGSNNEIFNYIRTNFSDAVAIEMEGYGFHRGVEEYHRNPNNTKVEALVIRGISDSINNQSDQQNLDRKETAARHASAFAFEIIANLKSKILRRSERPSPDIDVLVQEVREQLKPFVQRICGTIKSLRMPNPIGIADIYTNVNFLTKLPRSRILDKDKLDSQVEHADKRDLKCLDLGGISETVIPEEEVVEIVSQKNLIVWGQAGAGKTTFLKHLAIQCSYGKFYSGKVPIFISIEKFVKTQKQLIDFIEQIFADRGVAQQQISELLKQGRLLILLDGLDEVQNTEDIRQVLNQIQNLVDRFCLNRFVIACRLGGTEYGFQDFQEIEVADFDNEQIAQFVNKWFPARARENRHLQQSNADSNNAQLSDSFYDIYDTETAAKEMATKFLKKLEADKSIKELAASPLLLTMLCLAFEENVDLPKKRFDLYKEAIDILLIKWDTSRNIERHVIYEKLELRAKRDLLSYIGYKTFNQNVYFFQKEEVEQYITNFIRTLPNAQSDPEVLQFDSERVLKSIETQHGLLAQRADEIYSFSHITFQEYFAARQIITTSNPQALDDALQNLVSHITERRWREVFFLVVGAQNPADYLLQLMKERIDALMALDQKLQKFLVWVNEQSLSVKVPYKRTSIRAFYLDINIDIDPDRTLGCAIDLNCTFVLAYASFLARVFSSDLISMLAYTRDLDLARVPNYADEPAFAIALSRSYAIDKLIKVGSNLKLEVRQKLQELKDQLPNINGEMESQLNWWKTHGKAWDDQVKELIVKPHEFGNHYSNFSEEQQKLLKQYYEANLLLVECMNIANMSPEVRSRIMEELLLPIAQTNIPQV